MKDDDIIAQYLFSLNFVPPKKKNVLQVLMLDSFAKMKMMLSDPNYLISFASSAQKLFSEFDQRCVGQGGIASGHEAQTGSKSVNRFHLRKNVVNNSYIISYYI